MKIEQEHETYLKKRDQLIRRIMAQANAFCSQNTIFGERFWFHEMHIADWLSIELEKTRDVKKIVDGVRDEHVVGLSSRIGEDQRSIVESARSKVPVPKIKNLRSS